MKAIVVDRWMRAEELAVREMEEPACAPGTAVVEVRAAGCNFFDTLLVAGKYQMKPSFPFVPGAELAGVVREVGPGVEGVRAGDRVMASVPLGAFAERITVPASLLVRIPERMGFEEAAAFPIVYPTSYAALVYRGALREGEALLVTAAAGGVGLAAIEIGKALGARVLAAAGGAEKCGVAKAAGADVTIDYKTEDLAARAKQETRGRGVDVVVEAVGGEIFEAAMKSLAWEGRLVVVGFAGGTIPEVRANRILLKNIAVVGLHWGQYALHDPVKFQGAVRAALALYEAGKLSPRVWRALPLERAGEALGALASRKTWGKVVLRISDD